MTSGRTEQTKYPLRGYDSRRSYSRVYSHHFGAKGNYPRRDEYDHWVGSGRVPPIRGRMPATRGRAPAMKGRVSSRTGATPEIVSSRRGKVSSKTGRVSSRRGKVSSKTGAAGRGVSYHLGINSGSATPVSKKGERESTGCCDPCSRGENGSATKGSLRDLQGESRGGGYR